MNDRLAPASYPRELAAFADEALVLQTRVGSSWENIRPVVEYTRTSVATRLSPTIGDRAALVIHELLENGLKYGTDVIASVYVRSFRGFELRVCNRAVPSRITLLEKEIRRISAAKPQDAFMESVKRAPTLGAGISMIGLSRIRFEGEVQLELLVSGQHVTLVAKE